MIQMLNNRDINNIGDMRNDEFRKYGHQFVDWIADYLHDIEHYPVLPNVKPGDIKDKLSGNPPENGESFQQIFSDIENIILPGVTHWNHPNFMAYFNSTSSGPGILGELLSSAFNTNGMLWKSCPASTELEEVTINWLRKMMNLPPEFWGIIYDTASVSSMHAIAAAREKIISENNDDSGYSLDRLTVYTSEQAHSSIEKCALTIGIKRENIRKIPVDRDFKMRTNKLRDSIDEDMRNSLKPFFITATIGTTSTTSIDPVKAISSIAKEYDVWLHVDAAHAGIAAIVPEYNHILNGCDSADSVVVNPHKWLFVPIDLSILFIKRKKLLKKAFSLTAEYLKTDEDSETDNYMDYGIQLGRRFRSLKLWFVIRYFGKNGLISRIREHISAGQQFAEWIDFSSRFERLAPVPLSTVCFRAIPKNALSIDDFNQELLHSVNNSGKVFLSHTKLNGIFTIRLVVSGIRTEISHVENVWKLINEHFEKLDNK